MPMDETCPKQKQIRGEIQMSIDFLKTLETGISSIDKDHHQIIQFVNLISAASEVQHQRILRASVIESLRTLLVSHFGREEDLMFAIDYPHTTEHITDHSVMITSFDMNMLSYKETGNPGQILDSVSDWVNLHIANQDTSLASFIHRMRVNKAEMVKAKSPKVPTPMTARQAGLYLPTYP